MRPWKRRQWMSSLKLVFLPFFRGSFCAKPIFLLGLANLANSGDTGTILLKEHFLNMKFGSNFYFRVWSLTKSLISLKWCLKILWITMWPSQWSLAIENISKWPMLRESNLFLIEMKMWIEIHLFWFVLFLAFYYWFQTVKARGSELKQKENC